MRAAEGVPAPLPTLEVSVIAVRVNVAGDPIVNLEGDDYQVGTRVRARLNFDAREETELGTLRAFARLQATNTAGANNGVDIDQAYIQLGGLLSQRIAGPCKIEAADRTARALDIADQRVARSNVEVDVGQGLDLALVVDLTSQL